LGGVIVVLIPLALFYIYKIEPVLKMGDTLINATKTADFVEQATATPTPVPPPTFKPSATVVTKQQTVVDNSAKIAEIDKKISAINQQMKKLVEDLQAKDKESENNIFYPGLYPAYRQAILMLQQEIFNLERMKLELSK